MVQKKGAWIQEIIAVLDNEPEPNALKNTGPSFDQNIIAEGELGDFVPW